MSSDGAKKNPSSHIWLISYLILLFIVAVTGWFTTEYLGDKARQEIIEYSESIVSLHSAHFTAEFENVEKAVGILSGSPYIASALLSGKDRDIANANSALDRYNSNTESSVCYLMDGNGKTIASSNRNDSDSFVGKSYQFRPYFTQAIKGARGSYFALGITSRKRGFYSSYPVRDGRGGIIGVVVIKLDIDPEEGHLKKYPLFFLVNPNGIIFISSNNEMNLKSLWPLSRETQLALLKSKQFGEKEFVAILPREVTNGMAIEYNEEDYLVSRKTINPEGWSIVFMSSSEKILIYKLVGLIMTILICAIITAPLIIHYRISKSAELVRDSEIRFRLLFQNITSGFALHEIILNDEGQPCDYRFLEVNPAFEQLTGLNAQDLIGRTVLDVMPDTELHWIENYGRVAMTGNPVRFDNYSGELSRFYECLAYCPRRGQFAVLFTDITDRKKMEDEITAASITDQLTGLYNRRGFLTLAGLQLKLSDRNKKRLELFFADLDGLKQINDKLGHEEGDKALIEAANIFRGTFRTSDIIARLGGDEFAVLAIDTGKVDSRILTARLQQLIDIRNNQKNRKYRLSISMGCSYYDLESPCSIDELIARADKLMYEQKQKKKAVEKREFQE